MPRDPHYPGRPARSGRLIGLAGLFTILGLFALPRAVQAGPNSGGFLILHCNQELEFTTDGDFNGYSDLYDCETAVTQVPGESQGVIYFVLAAFGDFGRPDIKALSFGIQLSSPMVQPFKYGASGDDPFEVPDNFWPGSGSAVGLNWTEPLNQRLNEVYWFIGYAYAGHTVKLTRNPRYSGSESTDIVDSQTPSEGDNFEEFGMLGFGVRGYNPCSGEVATGACCSSSGSCILQTESGCSLFTGYSYQGDNSVCSPNPCIPGVGACCVREECRMLEWDDCVRDARGEFMGEGIACQPMPCNPQVESTWGEVKSKYRGW